MHARTTCNAVTANRVSDGAPIYFTASGTWSRNIAEVIAAADPSRLLAAAKADPLSAIAPYVIEVAMVDGRVQPVGLRERIRAFGPTA